MNNAGGVLENEGLGAKGRGLGTYNSSSLLHCCSPRNIHLHSKKYYDEVNISRVTKKL